MMKNRCWILAMILLWTSLAWAQVSFDIGPQVIAINEYLRFQVIQEGKSGDIPYFPKGLESENFELIRTSPDTQSSMTMINGQVSQKMMFTFYLRAKKTGKLPLEPQSVTLGGKTYSSPRMVIDVGEEDRNVGGNRSDPLSDFFGRRNRNPRQAETAEIFAEASLPKTTFYLGEPIPYSMSIFRTPGVEISNSSSSMDLPDFENFWSEEMDVKQEIKRVRRDNKILEQIVISQRQLFASKTGKLTIPPATFKLTVTTGRGFFADWQTVNRSSNPLEVTVKPLPQNGKPAGFEGFVGTFRVQGEIDKSKLAVGESLSLKVDVTGTGNFNAINTLKLKSPGHDLEIFDGGTPTVERVNGVVVKKTWVFALVPKREGTYSVDLPQFAYFDLDSESYKMTSTRTFSFDVEGGQSLVATGPVGAERTQLMASQNLNYIKQGSLGMVDQRQKIMSPRPLLWLVGTFLLLNLGLFAGRIVAGHMRGAAAHSRPKLALKTFQKNLDQLVGSAQGDAFYAGIGTAIFGYFGDKWQRPPQGISLEDIASTFEKKAWPMDLVQELTHVVERCELARFTPANEASREELVQAARDVIRRMDEVVS